LLKGSGEARNQALGAGHDGGAFGRIDTVADNGCELVLALEKEIGDFLVREPRELLLFKIAQFRALQCSKSTGCKQEPDARKETCTRRELIRGPLSTFSVLIIA